MKESATSDPASRQFKSRIALLTIALLLSLYFGIYIWARTTGLFHWARMRAEYITPGHVRTIMPVGHMNVAIIPGDEMPPDVMEQRQQKLASDKRISRWLWQYYSWLAKFEAACSPDMASSEK